MLDRKDHMRLYMVDRHIGRYFAPGIASDKRDRGRVAGSA